MNLRSFLKRVTLPILSVSYIALVRLIIHVEFSLFLMPLRQNEHVLEYS